MHRRRRDHGIDTGQVAGGMANIRFDTQTGQATQRRAVGQIGA